jgi:hypothetical protein
VDTASRFVTLDARKTPDIATFQFGGNRLIGAAPHGEGMRMVHSRSERGTVT